MGKIFKNVAVGGTFDEFHKGHEALLRKAFNVGEGVLVGLSSDEFVRQLGKPHKTASYTRRMKELQVFLEKSGLLQRAKIIPLDNVYGVTLSKGCVEALIVSKETEPTALKINRRRKEIGLTPLQIVVIDMIPSENHSPISTTRIRQGRMDREGNILKPEDGE